MGRGEHRAAEAEPKHELWTEDREDLISGANKTWTPKRQKIKKIKKIKKKRQLTGRQASEPESGTWAWVSVWVRIWVGDGGWQYR